MDGSRFDAWTRRRVGFAAGGLAAAVFGGVALGDADDKKKKGGKKRKRCKKLGQSCHPNGKRKCCGQRVCDTIESTGSTSCCKQLGEPCVLGECCNFLDMGGSGCVGGTCILI